MFERDRFGWEIDPKDSKGVVRGRTKLGQLVVWIVTAEMLRSVCDEELGKGVAHPGLYVLLDDETDNAYVGESSDLRARLGQHLEHPPRDLGRFDRALMLNDGRASVHSRFTDSTLREALEQAAIAFLQTGGPHHVVNHQRQMPDLSVNQLTVFNSLRGELGHVLYELELIDDRPKAAVDNTVIQPQDAARRFPELQITDVKGYEGRLGDHTVYFRKGTEKPQGLQITIRVNEPFGKSVIQGEGQLCISRGRCYLIPTAEIRDWLGSKLKQQTVDIFLDIETEVLKTAGVASFPVSQFGSKKSSKE